MTQGALTLTGVVTLTALGDALKRIREGKGLTMDDMDARAGIDKGNLSKLEKGQAGYSHDSLGRLADALGTPLSQIFALAEEIQNGRATPDTVRLVTTMESLPSDKKGHLSAVVDAFTKSLASEVWDGKLERRKGGQKK